MSYYTMMKSIKLYQSLSLFLFSNQINLSQAMCWIPCDYFIEDTTTQKKKNTSGYSKNSLTLPTEKETIIKVTEYKQEDALPIIPEENNESIRQIETPEISDLSNKKDLLPTGNTVNSEISSNEPINILPHKKEVNP